MRSIIPTAAATSRSVMVAVVLGTALTAGGSRTQAAASAKVQLGDKTGQDTIRDITRYCQACWRNARLPADRWADCTQQVFTRLLENVPADRWAAMLHDDGEEKKEFFRAIDAVKKRSQRARRYAELTPDVRDNRNPGYNQVRDQREAIDLAAEEVLSPRQQKIVALTADGWAVPDIAVELKTTPERVSDEKYKAIRKLREHLGVDANS